MSNFLTGLIYSLLFLGILLVIEYTARKNNYPQESTRKVAHLLSSLFGIAMAFILQSWVFIAWAIIFSLILGISYLTNFLTSIHGVKRKTYGEILFPLGILSAYLISGGVNTSYLVAVLILGISDPLSGILGGMKSLSWPVIGSLAFFISTLTILLFFLGNHSILSLLAIAALLTIVEKISPYGTDNLSIPLAGSLLLRILF